MSAGFFKPDIRRVMLYTQNKDISGLLTALKVEDPNVSEAAADALLGIGGDVTERLLAELRNKDKHLRLGIIGVLSRLGDGRAVAPLIGILSDNENEVRWQAAIALGELRDPTAAGPLTAALKDPDKYVRYGAAAALTELGWEARDDNEKAYYYAAVQDWDAVKNIGRPAIAALESTFNDRDPVIRLKVVRTLGGMGISGAAPVIIRALSDADREVRWHAVLASQKCGIPLLQLPRALAGRPKDRKSPLIAGFMNFMLPGLGYGYLGKWWGIMIFQIDITATVWLFRFEGESNTYLILFPIYLVLAIHAWYLAEKMPEDPP